MCLNISHKELVLLYSGEYWLELKYYIELYFVSNLVSSLRSEIFKQDMGIALTLDKSLYDPLLIQVRGIP